MRLVGTFHAIWFNKFSFTMLVVTKVHYFVKLFSEKSHDTLVVFPQINSPLLQKQLKNGSNTW